jgi:hypothetical protein
VRNNGSFCRVIRYHARWALVGIVLVGLLGCAPQRIQLQPAGMADVRNAGKVRAVAFDGATYLPCQPMGLLGYGLSKLHGREIMKEHQVEGPVLALKAKFVERLTRDLGLPVTDGGAMIPEDALDRLRTSIPEEYVISLQTTYWGHKPAGFLHMMHRVLLVAFGRLVRVRDGQVLWQGRCNGQGKQEVFGQALHEDGASLLKSETRLAAEECAAQLVEDLLGTR